MRRIAPVVLFLGCGGGAKPAAAPVDRTPANEGTSDGITRVYAWDGTELVGLYCATPNGLETASCAWPKTLTLPLEPPRELTLDVHDRVLADDSQVSVRGYGARRHAELVIASDAGMSIWTRETTIDGAGVATLPMPRLSSAVRPTRGAPEPDPRPSYMVPGYHVTPLVAIDLDRDGVAEVIYQSDDDGGDFVAADELELEDGFRARSGG